MTDALPRRHELYSCGHGWRWPYNLKHSTHCTASLPCIATQSTGAGLLEILKEILAYGICGLYAKYNRVYNVFLHEPFFVESLNRAFFWRKTGRLRPIWRFFYNVFLSMSITWRGPTPGPTRAAL